MTLDKARAALDAARELDIDGEVDSMGLTPIRVAETFGRLVTIAKVQAEMASAEALERIAVALEALADRGAR